MKNVLAAIGTIAILKVVYKAGETMGEIKTVMNQIRDESKNLREELKKNRDE